MTTAADVYRAIDQCCSLAEFVITNRCLTTHTTRYGPDSPYGHFKRVFVRERGRLLPVGVRISQLDTDALIELNKKTVALFHETYETDHPAFHEEYGRFLDVFNPGRPLTECDFLTFLGSFADDRPEPEKLLKPARRRDLHVRLICMAFSMGDVAGFIGEDKQALELKIEDVADVYQYRAPTLYAASFKHYLGNGEVFTNMVHYFRILAFGWVHCAQTWMLLRNLFCGDCFLVADFAHPEACFPAGFPIAHPTLTPELRLDVEQLRAQEGEHHSATTKALLDFYDDFFGGDL